MQFNILQQTNICCACLFCGSSVSWYQRATETAVSEYSGQVLNMSCIWCLDPRAVHVSHIGTRVARLILTWNLFLPPGQLYLNKNTDTIFGAFCSHCKGVDKFRILSKN